MVQKSLKTPLHNIKMAPYVVSVKSTVKILSIFVALLENMNFITFNMLWLTLFRSLIYLLSYYVRIIYFSYNLQVFQSNFACSTYAFAFTKAFILCPSHNVYKVISKDEEF